MGTEFEWSIATMIHRDVVAPIVSWHFCRHLAQRVSRVPQAAPTSRWHLSSYSSGTQGLAVHTGKIKSRRVSSSNCMVLESPTRGGTSS